MQDRKYIGPKFGQNFIKIPSPSFRIEKFYPPIYFPSEEVPPGPTPPGPGPDLRYPSIYNYDVSGSDTSVQNYITDSFAITDTNIFFIVQIAYNMIAVNQPFPLYNMNGTLSNISLPIVANGSFFIIKCDIYGTIQSFTQIGNNNTFKYINIKTYNNNLYVCGSTLAGAIEIPVYNFSTSIGSPQFTIPSSAMTSVIKFDTNGNAISWSTLIGNNIRGLMINTVVVGIDSQGNLYTSSRAFINDFNSSTEPVTCYSFSSTNNLGSNTLTIPAQITTNGAGNIIIKYDSSLNPVAWTFGDNFTPQGYALNNNVLYIANNGSAFPGNSSVFNFYPSTSNNDILNTSVFNYSITSSSDYYIIKYDLTSGTASSWTLISNITSFIMNIDSSNNLYTSYRILSTSEQIRNFSTNNTVPSIAYTTPTFPSINYFIFIKYVNNVPSFWYFNSVLEYIYYSCTDSNGNLYLSIESATTGTLNIYDLVAAGTTPTSTLSFNCPVNSIASYIIKFNSSGTAVGYYPVISYNYVESYYPIYCDSSNNLYAFFDYYNNSSENVQIYNLSTTLGTTSKEMVPLNSANLSRDNFFILKWDSSGIIQP